MNRVYARLVLSEVTGESYSLSENKEVLDRMAAELEKAYQAGVDSANQDAVPSRVRRLWENLDMKLHVIPVIGVRILELFDTTVDDPEPTKWVAFRLRDGVEDKWDFGSYCASAEAAVVEAIAMRKDPQDAIDGEYANKLMGLE